MNWKHRSYEVKEDGDENDDDDDDDDDDDGDNDDDQDEDDDDGDEYEYEHDQDDDDARLVDRRSTGHEFRFRTLTGTRFMPQTNKPKARGLEENG
ncbi:trigger factor-like [Bombus pyrosoma]|uniref:trigger factor-like n=1 Tax=Bombus pyrosoma TaxID=396416 RepID=UPI001CB94F72|nr:trigger factor-like [Bombus pyrosoma]